MLIQVFFVPIVLTQFLQLVQPQEPQHCSKIRSTTVLGAVEVHCSCMEQLIEWNEPIHQLTINQTGCGDKVLELNWNTLQTYIGVKKVIFDHASITFFKDEPKMKNCSVTEISFYNSYFAELPSNAFNGLKIIEKILIEDSRIGSILSHAYSGFKYLKFIHFVRSKISVIKGNSFSNLPQLEELSFINSEIEVFENKAIHLIEPKGARDIDECPASSNGRTLLNHLTLGFTARSFDHVENITLPEYGSKLLFFASLIAEFRSQSILSNTFSYIIFGGNIIDELQSHAIEAEIKNDCDISALLLIGNTFNIIHPRAFVDVIGDEETTYNTIFTIIDNTFLEVKDEGFVLDSRIETPFVKLNNFNCTSCNNFLWVLRNEKTEIEIGLKKDLVENGQCINENSLVEFLKGCDEVYPPELTTEPLLTSASEHFSSNEESLVGSKSSAFKCNFPFIFGLILLYVSIF